MVLIIWSVFIAGWPEHWRIIPPLRYICHLLTHHWGKLTHWRHDTQHIVVHHLNLLSFEHFLHLLFSLLFFGQSFFFKLFFIELLQYFFIDKHFKLYFLFIRIQIWKLVEIVGVVSQEVPAWFIWIKVEFDIKFICFFGLKNFHIQQALINF